MRIRSILTTMFVAGAAVAAPIAAGATGTTSTVYRHWTPPLLLKGGGAEPSIRTSPDGKYAAYISAPALSDLVSGQVQLMIDPIITALSLVQGGQLRALAVASARR